MQSLNATKVQSWLAWFLKGVLIVGFLVLLSRLLDLQVIKGAYYRELSEGNRIRRVPIVAARGKILAASGEVLVGNKEIKRRVVFDPAEGYTKTDDITGASDTELISEWMRDYRYGSVAAHLTGYLGEAGEDEVGKVRAACPEKGPKALGAQVGRTGLEEQYDCLLAGVDGEELVEVDALGNKVRLLGRREPVAGSDLSTTINGRLQAKVAELMQQKTGAVVVTGKDGDVLAFYSSPAYDPNTFVNTRKKSLVSDTLTDPALPLFNRVIGGKFHPGSTYKPIVAIAALEEGVINDNYTFQDTGQIAINTVYGNYSYSNWYFTQYGGVEGEIKLPRAIARSTDTFFYKVGELTGVDNLVHWSEKFKLDKKTGIDLPGEIVGLVPSPKWKEQVRGERWFLGNTYHMAIGQGDLALTPIGLNTAIATIANNGNYCPPHIGKVGQSENYQLPISDFRCRDLGIEKSNVDLVKEGMVGACSSGGTGFTFFDFEEKAGVKAACKTGTAETDDTTADTHAWFVAFAPVDNPDINVTVLVERGGEGSEVAGPIARSIFDFWYGLADKNQQTPTPADD